MVLLYRKKAIFTGIHRIIGIKQVTVIGFILFITFIPVKILLSACF